MSCSSSSTPLTAGICKVSSVSQGYPCMTATVLTRSASQVASRCLESSKVARPLQSLLVQRSRPLDTAAARRSWAPGHGGSQTPSVPVGVVRPPSNPALSSGASPLVTRQMSATPLISGSSTPLVQVATPSVPLLPSFSQAQSVPMAFEFFECGSSPKTAFVRSRSPSPSAAVVRQSSTVQADTVVRQSSTVQADTVIRHTSAAHAEVVLLRQRLSERDLQVDQLNREVGEMRERLAEQARANIAEAAPTQATMEDLRNSIGEQRQELAELHRLRQIIEDQSRETIELRAKTAELVATNVDLGMRVAELEQGQHHTQSQSLEKTFVSSMEAKWCPSDDQYSHVPVVHTHAAVASEPSLADDTEDVAGTESQPFQPRPPPPRSIAKWDPVDHQLQEYLNTRPEFALNIEKIKAGWYYFGEPVGKKLYLKVSGDHVVCRVGGGHHELFKYLDGHRLATQNDQRLAQQTEAVRARSKRRAARDSSTGSSRARNKF